MKEQFLIDALRQHGLKITPQRHLICRLVAWDKNHPSAEELYERALRVMPTLSLKTVYTTLNELAQIGVIRLVRFGTDHMRVDIETTPHAHMMCTQCGKLFDITIEHDALAALATKAENRQFSVDNWEITARGRCAYCKNQNEADVVLQSEEVGS